MTPIEIMALIFIIVGAIKLIVILVKPKAWASLVKKVWSSPILVMIVALILAAITLNYLLVELSIIHIFAVMLFTALLAAISMAAYPKEIVALAQKMLKDKAVIKKAWLSIIIWIVLIIWGLSMFF